jgi:hypothetical protein
MLNTTNAAMKKAVFIFFCFITTQTVLAQTASNEVLAKNDQTLRERFLLMKSKSQTYQDYKVIKEYVLDGVIKIVQDSLLAKDAALKNVKADVERLKGELSKVNMALKQKEQSMDDVVYASTHITVLGIDFQKQGFLTLVVIVFLALLAGIGLISARLKMLHSSMREKADLFEITSKEYEDYKRKALEKQTKLSRELQDERNKLHR